jgi:hypothetical protein
MSVVKLDLNSIAGGIIDGFEDVLAKMVTSIFIET